MSTHDRVARVIDRLFGIPPEGLHPDDDLADGLQLDSLSVVELQMALEDEFGVTLAADPAPEVRTLGDLVDLVAAALPDAAEEAAS